jgi:PleD family two-component response regulator
MAFFRWVKLRSYIGSIQTFRVGWNRPRLFGEAAIADPSRHLSYAKSHPPGFAAMPTILVVDPQPDIHLVIREILEDCGHKVIEAERTAEGLGLINSEDPDLVVMDLNTDEIDGAEAFASIRQRSESRT